MQSCNLLPCGRSPSLAIFGSPPTPDRRTFGKESFFLRYRYKSTLRSSQGFAKAQASNVNVGTGSYEDAGQSDKHKSLVNNSTNETSSQLEKPFSETRYLLSIAAVLLGCTLAFLLIVSSKGGPSALVAALAKSSFTAAFTLIFISEIGDKTFFHCCIIGYAIQESAVRYSYKSRFRLSHGFAKAQASNVNVGAGSYEGAGEPDVHKSLNNCTNETSSQLLFSLLHYWLCNTRKCWFY